MRKTTKPACGKEVGNTLGAISWDQIGRPLCAWSRQFNLWDSKSPL
jgi:hypothetical protein